MKMLRSMRLMLLALLLCSDPRYLHTRGFYQCRICPAGAAGL